MKSHFHTAMRRAVTAAAALVLGVGLFSAAPMAVAAPAVNKLPDNEPPIPSFAGPMVPDPVPIRNARSGLVLLPPDPYSATTKTGLNPALGFSCPACRAADVWGGDVAVSWDDGKGGTFIIFGDTIGFDYYLKPRMRSNTLAWTRDKSYLNGIHIDKWLVGKDGKAKEALPSLHKDGFERSKIPTGGFSHKGVQYVGWQSVSRVVNDSRRWLTSRSGLSASYDHGKTWRTVFTRPQGRFYQFQQVTYAKRGKYLYEFGTRQGRQLGGLGVARVPLNRVQDRSAREYWTGLYWAKNEPTKALPVLSGLRGEVSVQWDPFFRRFNLLRIADAGVVLSTSPNGVLWSPGREIYHPRSTRYSIYAPQLLPNRRGANLDFLLSVWQDYNVVTMYTPLGF